ncbi:MAG: iron-sulfur cluster assembly protein [Pseudomonadota bacterium]
MADEQLTQEPAQALDDTGDATAASAQPGADQPSGSTPVPGSSLSQEELEQLTTSIVGALSSVYDPEIPVDIYNLGLIYRVDVDDDRKVDVTMTLTTPMCPVAGEMPGWVQNAISSVDGVQDVAVELTFDPPWHPGMVTHEGREHFEMVMGYPLPGG